MKDVKQIKLEVEKAVNAYFENEAAANDEPGMFGKITGKLRGSKEILETVGQRAVDILNQYHEELSEEQAAELMNYTRELLPTAYKKIN